MRSVERLGPACALPSLAAALIIGTAACDIDRADSDGGWAGRATLVGGRTVVENPRASIWADDEGWRLAEDLRLGTADEADSPELFGNVTGIAVSEGGRIAVLDGQAREVRIFDPEGRHLTTFGGPGEGPGEFEGPAGVHFDALGRIWVLDVGASAYHVFTDEGEFVRRTPRDVAAGLVLGDPGTPADPPGVFFDPGVRRGDDRRLHRTHVLVDTTGIVVDSLPPVVEAHRTADVVLPFALNPYIPRTVSRVAPSGDAWIAATDEYVLYRRTSAGDTVAEVRLPVSRGALAPWQEEEIRRVIDEFDSPVAPPVDRREAGVGPQLIRSVHVGSDGHLFVRPVLGERDDQDRVFDVFDPEGRYLGQMRSSFEVEGRPPPLFLEGYVYAASSDPLGVPLVIRGRIEGWSSQPARSAGGR